MSFATAVNCIDGRTQEPLIAFVKSKFNVDYVDMITEPGVDLVLTENKGSMTVDSIVQGIKVSIEAHQSEGICIAGHANCAANPTSDEKHHEQIKKSVQILSKLFKDLTVVGVWIDSERVVHQL